jgi:hypothetical protein
LEAKRGINSFEDESEKMARKLMKEKWQIKSGLRIAERREGFARGHILKGKGNFCRLHSKFKLNWYGGN